MGMFFDVLNAINNPNLQGNVSQLETVINMLHSFAEQNNIPPSTMETILSTLGSLVKTNLRQSGGMGNNPLGGLLGQAAGAMGGAAALQALFPPQVQQQFAEAVAQRTGLDAGMIQSALPVILPAVMSLLNMGTPKSGVGGSNPLLAMFLDGDRDGDTDLGDVYKLATRYINRSAA